MPSWLYAAAQQAGDLRGMAQAAPVPARAGRASSSAQAGPAHRGGNTPGAGCGSRAGWKPDNPW
jgi:hypothetical protein